MNKTYKSIWNETLGTYVAASETATSAGRKTTSTRRSRRAPARAHAGQLVLEQRIVFDAALPATMIEVSADSDSGHQELVDAYEVDVEADEVSVAPTTRDNEEGSPEASPPNAVEAGDGIDSADSADSIDSLDPAADSETDGVEQSVLEADEQASEADELTGAEEDQIDEDETDAGLDPVRVEIIVVDSVVADITDFIASHPGEIIYLDPNRDGVEQLAEALQGRTDVDAIHILSHGEAGQVHLGSSTLTTESIQGEHADDMEIIRAALSPDADLLLYGCDIAEDEVGMSFVQALAEATGADVAASVDATGASELGGDWVLEAQQGQVETDALAIGDWQGLLGTSISITSTNVLSSGLGFSVQAYNSDGTPGTVSVQTGTPPGFGVAGVASGADSEIGEIGGLAEQLEITFDGSVESADVWIAWLNSSETALVNLYQGGDLVGSWTQFSGTDTVDGPFQLNAGGVPFDRMVFTVPTDNASTADDYLVNRIDFVLMRPPSAQNDAFTTSEDAPVNGNLFANNGSGFDTDPDGDSFAVTANTDPANGTVVISPNGDFTYTPNANFNGADSFTYTITDSDGGTSTATVTVTVTPVNDAPVGADDSITASEDVPFVGTLPVAADVDGDALSYALTSAPANGSVVINGDGSYTYTPAADYNGADSFTYTVSDGNGGSNTYTVSVGVTPVQDTVADNLSTPEDTAMTFNVLTGTGGASADNFEGTPQVTATSSPTNGVIVVSPDGTITYTPNANYSGPDSFTYTVTSPAGVTETETVNITVTSVNDVPVVDAPLANQSDMDGETITPIATAGSFSDIDGDTLSFSAAGLPAGLTIDALTGEISGTLSADASQGGPGSNGVYSVTVTANDGNGGTVSESFTWTVGNPAPVATDDGFTAAADAPVAVVGNALGNDSDPDGDALTVAEVNGAAGNVGNPVAGSAGGLFTVNPDGSVSFDPNGEFDALPPGDTVTTTVSYTVSDGQGGTDTATITVTVTGTNNEPVATDDVFAVGEDDAGASLGNVITGDTGAGPDSDIDGGTLTVTEVGGAPGNVGAAVAGSAGGLFTVNPDGSVSFDPNGEFDDLAPGETSSTTISYTISDGQGGFDTATITVTVNGLNDAPDAVDDSFTTDEDTSVNIPVLGNDSDPDGDPLTVSEIDGQPAVVGTPVTLTDGSGTVTLNLDGTLTFEPTPDYNGPVSFTYEVEDGNGGSDTATVTGTVNPVNDAPDAVDDSFTTDEDTSVNIPVLGNDSDPEGDPLTVSEIDGQPAVVGTPVTLTDGSGTVTLNVDGTLTFEPTPDYNGPVSFTYEVEDGNGGSDTATVTGTVNPVNDPPVAVADGFTAAADAPAAVVGNALGNDSDPDGDALAVTPQGGVAGSAGGVFSIDAAGAVSFDPAGAFDDLAPGDTRDTTLVYEISDGQGGFDTATITVTVTGVNNAPVATDNAYTVGEDDAAAVVGNALTDDSGSGVDSDVDGGTLVVTPQSGVAGSAGGIFSIDAAGVVTFDPNGEFENLAVGETATTTLVYEISDGQGGFDTATITVTVNGANDAPVGADDSITASEDVPFVGTLPVASDVDADALSYALTSAPANGSVVINGDGSYTYTPVADYNGADSFTYTVSDGNGGSNTYTVSVSVTPVQDTVADSLITPEDTAITFNVLTGAGGASADNFEGTPVVTATTNPANGVIVVAGDGTITYTPNANYSGPDSFTYTVTSPTGVTETETVNISVTSVNDVPVANDDSFTTDEDTSVNIPVLGNDSDPDGDPLTVSEIDGQPAVVGTPVTLTDGSGTVTLNLDGTLTFEPTPDYNGPVSFTYEVEDGNGGSDTATVTGTVNPVNDPPVAVDDGPFTTSANEPLTGNVLGNDSDPDGDPLTVTGFTVAGDPTVYPAGTTASMPGVGTLVIQPDGGFTFVPATDYVGPVPSATYTVSDGAATDTAVLSFGDVQPGPVPPTVVPPQPGPGTGPGPVPPIIDVLPEVNPPLVPVNPSPASVTSDAGGTSPVNVAPMPAAPAGQMPGNHLHVLVAVGESSQSQFLAGAGLAGIQANAPLLGEALSQTPDSLLFVQAGGNHLAGMSAEPGLGDVRQVPHSLHVQHAVRHQPIVSDIGLYVQQAVRASQLESAVRNAVLDAHHTATPGFDTLLDPFAMGAPRPDVPEEPAEKPASAPEPKAAEEQPHEGKPGSDQSVAESKTETPAPVEAPRLQPRAAVGFRAQLQRMGKDRSVSARPLTRDVAHV